MNSGITLVDLFCGAGGLSLGFKNSGYDILSAIDNDSEALTTYSLNIKTWLKPICKSIYEIKPRELLDYIKLEPKELDLLVGSPPCRGFSYANRQSRTNENCFNDLIYTYLDFIKLMKPRVFLLENVKGLMNFANGKIYNDLINKLKKLKYILNQCIFNCEDYGIPQRRERIIIIGTRRRKKINLKLKKMRRITVKDAIDDLPEICNGNREDPLNYKKNFKLSYYQEKMRISNDSDEVCNNLVTKNNDLILQRYKHIPQGGNWRDIPQFLMRNYSNLHNCHSSIYHRLAPDKPSITLCNFRKNMIIHPFQNRGLSVREAARIQSFPDKFIFKGGIGSQQQQVANAVPPKLSMILANSIKNFLN